MRVLASRKCMHEWWVWQLLLLLLLCQHGRSSRVYKGQDYSCNKEEGHLKEVSCAKWKVLQKVWRVLVVCQRLWRILGLGAVHKAIDTSGGGGGVCRKVFFYLHECIYVCDFLLKLQLYKCLLRSTSKSDAKRTHVREGWNNTHTLLSLRGGSMRCGVSTHPWLLLRTCVMQAGSGGNA